MSEETDRIEVSEGKYTFIHYDNDWRIHCLRYNEKWMIFEGGHHAIMGLMNAHTELQAENERVKEVLEITNRALNKMAKIPPVNQTILNSLEASNKLVNKALGKD